MALHPDSSYVIEVVKGGLIPKENVVMCWLAKHLFDFRCKIFTIRVHWVKGQSGDNK